jgi:hypothetical protein
LMIASMTSIIGSLSNYTNTFDSKVFKKKASDFASRFFSPYTYPNEHLHTAILRIALEGLAGVVTVFAMLVGGIPLVLGFIAYRALQPTDHFIIGNAGGTLTNEELLAHLQKLLGIQKQFSCIEIRSLNPLALNIENAKIFKQLHPNKLILPISNQLNVLENLETSSHYYQNDANSNVTKSIYHLVRKEKVSHLVLPLNPEEMVKTLKELVEKNERINRLYFLAMVPQKYDQEVSGLLAKLKPSLKLFINNQERLSTKTLEALLNS